MNPLVCLACGNAQGNRVVLAKEMMFGTGETFEYIECLDCKSLTLATVPDRFEAYYSDDYYSFANLKLNSLRAYVRTQRLRSALGVAGIVGGVISLFAGPMFRSTWLRLVPIRLTDRILDVGCGSGQLLFELRSAGFRSLVGLDPYVKTEVSTKGLTIVRRHLAEWTQTQDLIMMHHSFEHMTDPSRILADLSRILAPGGHAIIRTPVANCWAWRHYGVNWVQLDAPRHLFIPSVEGMKRLVCRAGLQLQQVKFDSTEFQFWASELYERGIPLCDAKKESYFTKVELRAYRRRADELNNLLDGDSVCFLLHKQS